MKNTLRHKKGFALFSVLFIIAAISLMLGMLIQIGGQRAFTAKKLVNQVKALAYAEAGIDYAYSIISTDFGQQTNASLSVVTSYADGSFDLTLTPTNNKYLIINSVGKCGDALRTAEILVDDENAGSGGSTPATNYSGMAGFDYAVLSGGVFDFGGCGTVGSPGSKLHSNSKINIKGSANTLVSISSHTTISIGNNKTITGDVTTPDPDWKPSKVTITGTSTKKAVPLVEIPKINLNPYYIWADAHSQVRNGFSTSSSYTPNGGILWVKGDVTISGGPGTVFNGSIIATGNIKVSGHVQIIPTTTVFGMASRDGNIENTSSGRINGLVYAKKGNYSQTANGELYGQLIINGTIKKGGNSDIINFVRSVPTPPGGPGSSAPTTAWPVVAAWQK